MASKFYQVSRGTVLKFSISQSLIFILMLALVLGPVMAFWDQRMAQGVVLAFGSVSVIGLYCLMFPGSRTRIDWVSGPVRIACLMLLVVLAVWCLGLIWAAS